MTDSVLVKGLVLFDTSKTQYHGDEEKLLLKHYVLDDLVDNVNKGLILCNFNPNHNNLSCVDLMNHVYDESSICGKFENARLEIAGLFHKVVADIRLDRCNKNSVMEYFFLSNSNSDIRVRYRALSNVSFEGDVKVKEIKKFVGFFVNDIQDKADTLIDQNLDLKPSHCATPEEDLEASGKALNSFLSGLSTALEGGKIPFNEHVRIFFKPGEDIMATMTPKKCAIAHAMRIISGEAGELVDTVKKHIDYNQPLDKENIIEEAGDLWFGLNALLNELDITMEEVEEHNRKKLAKRYPNGYNDANAKLRLDKQEEK